jgi:short-subunit dehydrogenase
MAERGARHLIFLSRSGMSNPEAQRTLEKLQSRGVSTQVITCDVTKKGEVTSAVEQASNGRFIKGVIHAAMVLEVRNPPNA